MKQDKTGLGDLFASLYGRERVEKNFERYRKAAEEHQKIFGVRAGEFFSAPGRIEIGGNHTDHNCGRVLATSVGIDCLCMASITSGGTITVYSEGFDHSFSVSLDDLGKREDEEGTTQALVRGIASRFADLGYAVGGWEGYITSEVPVGSGLSSSASIEVLLASVLNHLYNNGEIDPIEIAKAGQYAENHFFNKPCGLMDQIASACGGVVQIDFSDVENPLVEKVDFSFRDTEYSVLVVQTGSGHADLTPDYAAIPGEMRQVAGALGSSMMREVALEALMKHVGKLRRQVSDRAILRGYHFICENGRVVQEREALERGDMDRFLDLVSESGASSAMWLQNTFSANDPDHQGVTLALALTDNFFKKRMKGACRVHGGGFAGTMLAFVHNEDVKEYIDEMERVFGRGSVRTLHIRSQGAVRIGSLERHHS
jgi:galactokinase